MKKYNKYKDSGIEWIGEIPEHWESIKLKYIISIQSGKGITNEQFIENGEFDIYGGNGVLGKTDSYTNDGLDLIIGRVGALCGNIRLVDGKKWVSDNALLASTTQNPYFIEKCLKVLDLNRLANKNAQPLITGTMVKDQYIGLPSLEEQTTIANYLDHKTTQIDTLITKKEQFITLLQEERTALINQAVTKGLDPKVKMKDSGIEWLGEIPEHWEVKKLKYAAKIFRGKFTHRPRNDERLYNGEFPFFQTGDIARSDKFLTNYTQTLNELGLASSTLFLKDTIVMTIAANIGDIAILGLDACFPDSIVGFEPFDNIHHDYFYFTLKSKRDEFINASIKNTQLNLNIDRISTIYLTVPPIEEQEIIVSYIEKKMGEIDTLISKSQQEIELLKEYKTALISEVVTGKVDVRDAVLN